MAESRIRRNRAQRQADQEQQAAHEASVVQEWGVQQDAEASPAKAIIAWVVTAVLAVCAIGMGSYAVSTKHQRSDTLVQQRVQAQALQQRVDEKVASNKKEVEVVVKQATGGFDFDAKKRDDAVVEPLFEKTVTWDGPEAYTKQREAIMEEFDIAPSSVYMREFMPGELEGASRTAPDGTVYFDAASDVRSSLDSFRSYAKGDDRGAPRYFAVIEGKTRVNDQTTPYYATVEYTVRDEKVENIVPRIAMQVAETN